MFFAENAVSKSRASRTTLPQARRGGTVFGVGMRAFVNDAAGSVEAMVALNDTSGKVTLGYLVDGTEVEILGWIPRRLSTIYRVRATENHLTGWLGVANLRTDPGRFIISSPMPGPTPAVWISLPPRGAKP